MIYNNCTYILDKYPNLIFVKEKMTMRKILAIVLVVLMVVPFGVLSVSAAKVTLPAEPTLATDAPTYYIGHGGKGDKTGSSAANFLPTAGWDPVNYPDNNQMATAMANGGKFVSAGKTYIGATATIAATAKPVLFTAFDGTTDFTSKTAGGDFDYVSASGGNQGQIGMFMIISSGTTVGTATFMGDVIFDKICILDRSPAGAAASSTLEVGETGKMVIKDTVTVLKMHDLATNISVKEGGYLYLHATGFESYKGKGTIVIGDEIKDKVTKDTFAGFEGTLVYADGSEAFVEGGNQGGDNTQGGGNADTSDMTWAVAVVAAIAVMTCGVAVVSKKREN